MIDRSEYGIASAALLSAWYAGSKIALWLALHPWMEKLSQVLFTVAIGIATVTAQHYWRRFLHKRAPIEEQAQGIAAPQGEAIGRAQDRFGLLRRLAPFVRRGVLRLNVRRRPES